MSTEDRYKDFMEETIKRNPAEPEFHQAVGEFACTIIPHIEQRYDLMREQILERMTEADRIIQFRVVWEDDLGNLRINRGYRVQFNNALGPYKGGLRFHPSVNLSILKFLGFEQVFKNALTGLPIGGAKGGSDFNPKGKSDREVMRFCHAFMTELRRHIGANVDVPAGDIGVGPREIGYMYGQFKRLNNGHEGALTGKGVDYGGSLIRPEATGYGAALFGENVLKHHGSGLEGKTCLVSGSGNVAQYTVEKLVVMGAKVVTMSDSSGTIHDPDGINREKLQWVMNLKNVERGRIAAYVQEFGGFYLEGKKPWAIPADAAFPCATQNEICLSDARQLIKNGCQLVVEAANMPTEKAAIDAFHQARVFFAPSKAANAGGVAVSAMEMSQNAMRLSWTAEEVLTKLRAVMLDIHDCCVAHGIDKEHHVDYIKGANLSAFDKVAKVMLAYGFH